MKFYERLKELRNKKGVSQAFLAKKLNVTPGAIAHWELGNRNPDYNTLIKIADYFEVDVNYLIGQRDVSYRQPVDKNELKLADDYFLNVLGYRSDDDLMEQLSDKEKVDLYNNLKATGPHTKEELNKRFGTFNVEDYDKLLNKDSVIFKYFSLIMELVEMGVLDDLENLQPDDKDMVFNLIKRLEEKNKENAGV